MKLKNKITHTRQQTKTSFFNRSIKQSLLILVIALSGYLVYADYVGTLTNRIFLDPESLPVIADGYQVGDVISYIAESTPDPGSGSTVGAGAWNTIYLPPGVEVVGAAIVGPDGDGTYSPISAPAVAPIKNGCGGRGCAFPTTGSIRNGKLNENQQDAGIFYSTNSRTQLLSAPLGVGPTGSGNQEAWNLWDAQQVRAYGGTAQLTAGGPSNGAISPNGGKGNTAVVDVDLLGPGTIFKGTGSPVAGPLTYFTNDYNPSCGTVVNNTFEAVDLLCAGPWQRIAYMGSSIGGSGPVTPTTIAGAPPNLNTSVPTSSGFNLSTANALPTNTNALRYVLGKRVIGQLENIRITFRITNVAAFTASLMDDSFCIDATGGDTDKDGVTGRGAQDNIWRYYEGNNHSCFSGVTNSVTFKNLLTVDGESSSGTADANSILGYELKFSNTGTMPLYDINITDAPTTPGDMFLIAEGVSVDCPYSSYDGDAGAGSNLPTLSTLSTSLATWNELPVLGPGETVTLHVCGQVDNAGFGDPIRNQMSVSYATTDGGTPEPVQTSENQIVISTLISGTVFLDNDVSGTNTTGDTGINGVVVQLYRDENGDGVLDSGDSLLESATTNSSGQYAFIGQTDGDDYLVVETGLSGLLNTADKDTPLNTCAPGTLANTCNVIAFTLNGSNQINNFYNVGAKIGDFVYFDTNGNGTPDTGETGAAGVTIDLYRDTGTTPGVLDPGDTLIANQTTTGSGAYDFIGLSSGNYIVDITDTAGVITGYVNTSANDPLAVTVAAGQDFNAADFGYLLQADVTITKDDSVTEYTPGNPVTYVITVNNIGPSHANGTVIADTFPSQITTVSWTCTATGSAVCPNASGTSSPLSETIATFPNGGQLVYTVTAQTNPAATTDLTNSATATVPAGISDPTSVANVNTATDPTDTVSRQSDLYITKSDTPTTYTPGGTTTYTIVVGNLGPSNVIGATVSDTLPNGLSLSAPITCVATGTATCSSPIGAVNDTSFTDTIDIAADPSGIDGTGDNYVTYTVPVKYSTVMTDY